MAPCRAKEGLPQPRGGGVRRFPTKRDRFPNNFILNRRQSRSESDKVKMTSSSPISAAAVPPLNKEKRIIDKEPSEEEPNINVDEDDEGESIVDKATVDQARIYFDI